MKYVEASLFHMIFRWTWSFFAQGLVQIESKAIHDLVVAFARMMTSTADEIYYIVYDRNDSNQESDEVPPVLWHQFVKIDLCAFNIILNSQMPCLEKKITHSEPSNWKKLLIF